TRPYCIQIDPRPRRPATVPATPPSQARFQPNSDYGQHWRERPHRFCRRGSGHIRLTVNAYDIDPLSGDDFLGTDTTVDGNFHIKYQPEDYRPWFLGAISEPEKARFGS
ncbi:MAG: hypothetical protein ACRERX_19415, partial [Pseudomonas sp.]